MEWITHAEVLDADREGKGQPYEPPQLPSSVYSPIKSVIVSSGLLPLTSGDSDTDSLYDLEGKSKVMYY